MFGTTRITRALGAAVALLSLTAPLVLTPPAEASGSGCDNYGNTPRSCIQVEGSGTYVDWARGGVELAAQQDTRGHFEIWGADFRWVSEDETLSNHSFRGHTKWGKMFNIGRDLPDKSKVCASFFSRRGDGSYSKKQPACVEIQG